MREKIWEKLYCYCWAIMKNDEILKEIEIIKARNKRVEADKAWETSWTRKIIVCLFTYIVVLIFFLLAKLPDPFMNAIIPALAFILSSLSIFKVKKIWIKKFYK